MLFSIIIPTYNRAKFLLKALNSIKAQTCEDYEILIVDDGSIDNTAHLVAPLLGSNCTYIYQQNSERGAARNKGILAAKGIYAYFLDSDDLMLPFHVQQMKAVVNKYNFPDLISSSYCFNDVHSSRSSCQPSVDIISSHVLLNGNPFSCNYGIRLDAIRSRFPEDRVYSTMEDWMFLMLNSFPDRPIYHMLNPSVVMSEHARRSMHNHSQVLLARCRATEYLSKSLTLTSTQKKRLKNNSLLFMAVHQRLAGQYSAAIYTLLKTNTFYIGISSYLVYGKLLIRSIFALSMRHLFGILF